MKAGIAWVMWVGLGIASATESRIAHADQTAPSQTALPQPTAPAAGAGAPGASAKPKPTPDLAASSAEYAEDIREIRGPKYVFPKAMLEFAVAGLVLLAALAYGIWRWMHRARPAAPLLPFEIALKNLEAIRPLMRAATVREFSIEVSDIVRRYIEERFHVTAAHRTTEEFLHDLLTSTEATLAKHRKLLGEFLEQCDLAKFAGMSLSEANMEMLYQSARSFVIETSRVDTAQETRVALPAA